MSTTTLYAELIVVGSGAAIFILLLFYSVIGNSSWLTKIGELTPIGSAFSLIPVLSVIYLLGIVVSGMGYWLFESLETRLREKKLSCINRKYNEIRNALYTTSEGKNLIEAFEFRRSKIRICRGWFINSFLIIAALFYCCVWTGTIPSPIVCFLMITVGLLMIGTRVVWRIATENELGWLESTVICRTPIQSLRVSPNVGQKNELNKL